MSALLKLVILILFMVILPVFAGAAFTPVIKGGRDGERFGAGTVVTGYFLSFILCECIALPVLFLTPLGDFVLFSRIYAFLMIAAAVPGALAVFRHRKEVYKAAARMIKPGNLFEKRSTAVLTLAGAALFVLLLYMAYNRAFFDGDDAYYVTQSLLSVQTGTMYRYLPYTGITTSVDYRHALALFPMWTAALSRYSGMHPTIIAHSIEPLVFISLSALTFYRISGELFGDDREAMTKRASFMVILFVFWIFGNISIFTPETFLLTRTWQGKSILSNLLIPGSFLCLIKAGKHPDERAPYAEQFLLALSCGLFTSMAPAIILAFVLTGAAAVSLAVRDKTVFLKFLPAGAACLAYLILILAV